MKRAAAVSLALFFTASFLLAHAGEVHTYLGTVTAVSEDGSFVMKTTSGKELTVLVSKETAFLFTDGKEAPASELAAGRRVAAKIGKDGKTALQVKFSAKKTK